MSCAWRAASLPTRAASAIRPIHIFPRHRGKPRFNPHCLATLFHPPNFMRKQPTGPTLSNHLPVNHLPMNHLPMNHLPVNHDYFKADYVSSFTSDPVSGTPPLRVIPLGGLGEIGKNMMILGAAKTS